MALKFYHGHGSPYGWRVWLALEAKKIAYETQILSFSAGDTTKPEFVAINPRHQVPTIVDDGFALWESAVIVEYLDERFDSGAKLFPGDAKRRARVRRLAREAETYLHGEGVDKIVEELFWKNDAPPDPQVMEKARTRVSDELQYFARQLEGDYLDGKTIGAADVTLYPSVAYVKRITARKPEVKLADLIPAPIAAWAKRIESQPWFDQSFPPHWK
jgi:glutathione S-transferase